MDACEVDASSRESGFEELVTSMDSDLYWVRFFARPCCPAPDVEGAIGMLDHLKSDVHAREDFTDEQIARLCQIIDARKEWYPKSGLCRGSRG